MFLLFAIPAWDGPVHSMRCEIYRSLTMNLSRHPDELEESISQLLNFSHFITFLQSHLTKGNHEVIAL
jgi:hypothetical protein